MKISFIIAAYNAEAYISKCLDSILSQRFEDFEIIVIDDGSTDKTAAIAGEYAKKHSAILLLSQSNSGQGHARNAGVSAATGDYIWFVDSDDWIVEGARARIQHILDELTVDVLVVNFQFAFEDQRVVLSNMAPGKLAGRIFNPSVDPQTFATVSCWQAPPWRLITRRSIIVDNEIKFATGVFYEDHPFAIQLMLLARRVYLYSPVAYSYFQRSSSTTKNNDRKVFDFLTIRRECLALFERFNMTEEMWPIVLGYILPRDFYFGHVGPEYQVEFLKRLKADLTNDQIVFAQNCGIGAYDLFLQATLAMDPSILIDRALMKRTWRERLTIGGAKRFLARRRESVKSRIYGWAAAFRQRISERANPVPRGVDRTGNRYLEKGANVRVEAIHIDVRTAPEERPYVFVGDESHIGGRFVFERGIGEIRIGSRSSIGGGCLLICSQEEGITIGDNVMLSWNCTLIDSNMHSLDPEIRATDAFDWKCGLDAGRIGEYKDWTDVAAAPIVIKNNAWLGFDVSVAKGVTIGKGAVVGSKSHVTRDVPDYCVFGGAPARFVSLVPRKNWTWEELICAMNADPSKQDLLRSAYLLGDLKSSLVNFRTSGEFYETLQEIKRRAPGKKKIVDVGGGNGVMSVAFALEGFDVTLVEPGVGRLTGTAAAKKAVRIAAEEIDPLVDSRFSVFEGAIESFQPEKKFDLAYCRQVVHHLVDIETGLSRIGDLLAGGGLAFFVREHVVADDAELDQFLKSHPFHRYVRNEFAYPVQRYEDAIKASGFELLATYAFNQSRINFHPHTQEEVQAFGDKDIAGAPYTFIARKI